MRYVTLGCGRTVSLRTYVRAWRTVLAAPTDATFRGSPSDSRMNATREDALREFRDGMHDRINRHLTGFGHGRKWSNDWQRAVMQTASRVNTPRLIVRVREVPMHLRARLAHRLEEAWS
jgi:hypothetical protein